MVDMAKQIGFIGDSYEQYYTKVIDTAQIGIVEGHDVKLLERPKSCWMEVMAN